VTDSMNTVIVFSVAFMMHIRAAVLLRKHIFTDYPKHYDHLPNMLLVLHVLPKEEYKRQYRSPEYVLSGTKMLAADPSSPVDY